MYFWLEAAASGEDTIRTITQKKSTAFWDTVVWFGAMAVITRCVYAWTTAQSFYEYTTVMLVAWLFVNASFLPLFEQPFQDLPDGHSKALTVHFIPQSVSYFGAIVLVGWRPKTLPDMHGFAHRFADTACYADGFWLQTYLDPAFYSQTIILLVVGFWLFRHVIYRCRKTALHPRKNLRRVTQAVLALVIVLVSGTMWYDLYAILRIRSRAQTAFGSSYDDIIGMGYDQILAIGAIAQILVCCIISMLGKLGSVKVRTWKI